MKLGDLVPPADLLERVQGIERGLRARRRLSVVWWAAVAIAGVQLYVAIEALKVGWAIAGAAVLFAGAVLLALRTQFWLKESRSPFRYTCSVGEFSPVTEADAQYAWLSDWLRHDLYEKLSSRVGRLMFLDESHVTTDTDERPSHIHICGSYLVRGEAAAEWTVEVAPRVRIGPAGEPESFAHPVKFPIADPTGDSARDVSRPETDPPLGKGGYSKVLERVYFSVASSVYKQIRRDVESKIALLPTDRMRAAAYFYEARDYARSNTLDAHEEARALYANARRLYGPRRRPEELDGARRRLHELRMRAAERWPRLVHRDLMAARADVGYANTLVYRRLLARLAGRRLNPIFEARPVALAAVARLESLPEVPGVRDTLFDAKVLSALVWHALGCDEESEAELHGARALLPDRAEQDVRYLYAAGALEPRPRSSLPLLRRATELDQRFEVAQFAIAEDSEMMWRTRRTLEGSTASIVFKEYEEVLRINPGNVGAWAAIGYMQWLLGNGDEARVAFGRGREYKEITRDTFVAELDYGLARLAAEEGDFESAYASYITAVSANIAQGVSHVRSALSEYFFDLIGDAMLERFGRYRDTVEEHLRAASSEPESAASERVRQSVHAFVLNGYGEACFNYFLRSGDRRRQEQAEAAYKAARECNSAFVLPHYNLCLLEIDRDNYEAATAYIDAALKLEPEWPDAVLMKVIVSADLVAIGRPEAERQARIEHDARREAASLRGKADDLERSLSSTWAVLGAEVAGADVGITPARAAELRKRAGALERQADDARAQAERLRRQTGKAGEQSARALTGPIRKLVPHPWLWTAGGAGDERTFAWDALGRPDLDGQLAWERELGDLHVRALRTWAIANLPLASDDGERGQLARLLLFLRRRFWSEQLGELSACRGLPEHDGIDGLIDRRVERWYAQDPASHDAAWWSMWHGDKLGVDGDADARIHAYWRAAGRGDSADGTRNPDLLFELGWRLERLEAWEETEWTYRKGLAEQARVERADAGAEAGEARYRRGLGRALWERGQPEEAIREWQLAGVADELEDWWRTSTVIDIREHISAEHELLWTWLRGEQRRALDRRSTGAARDVAQALGSLSVAYAASGRAGPMLEAAEEGPGALMLAAPIALKADARLFPEGAQTEAAVRLLGKDLPELKARIRERTGVSLPGVRLVAWTDAPPGGYLILLHEVELAGGRVPPEGSHSPDTAQDPYEHMALHLESVIGAHLERFIGVEELMAMLREWSDEDSDRRSLVAEALGQDPDGVRLVQVLKRLVSEGVPVRRLDAILSAFAGASRGTAEVSEIVEHVRRALVRELPGNDAGRRLVTLSPELEAQIARSVRRRGGTSFIALPADEAPELIETVRSELAGLADGDAALVVRQAGLRPFVRRVAEVDFPELPVLEVGELSRPFAPLQTASERVR